MENDRDTSLQSWEFLTLFLPRSKRRRDAAEDLGDDFAGGFEDDTFESAASKKLRETKEEARATRKELKHKEAKDARREARKEKDAEEADSTAALRAAVAPTRLSAQDRREDAQKVKNDMLTPFEALRQKNKQRAKTTKGREGDTLARLAAFSSSLKSTKVARADAPPQPDPEPVTYAGQVLDDDDSDDDDGDWFAGKLKFRKHTDDLFRTGGDGRSADDYLTLDPREKPATYVGEQQRKYDRAPRPNK